MWLKLFSKTQLKIKTRILSGQWLQRSVFSLSAFNANKQQIMHILNKQKEIRKHKNFSEEKNRPSFGFNTAGS